MERVYIADLESDGLLDEATRIWCGVFKNVNTKEVTVFSVADGVDFPNNMLKYLDTIDTLIMHGGVGFDWPLLKKLYGYDYRGIKVDTLLISRLQHPNRTSPPSCPNKRAPHSVEAWGYRVGRHKPEHSEWDRFSEEMLRRCVTDVEIQYLLYQALIAEAEGLEWDQAHRMTLKLFERLQMSQAYGWKVDTKHMEKCIYFLTRWMDMIDRVVEPYLPMIVVVEETKKDGEYNYVRKPFKKDGTYTAGVNEFVLGAPGLRPVGGPYCRVSFRRTDLDSNLETKQMLLKLGWEPKEWNHDKDGNQTSAKLSKDDPFRGITNSLGRLIAKRVQCRHRRSTVVGLVSLVRLDGRIPSIITGIATTGRAKHKNIVNIPTQYSFFGKWMRQIFVAREGWKLVGTDSEGCQVRMLAARMDDDTYKAAVVHGDKAKGTDQHSLTMTATGITSRTRAKNFFFGLIFGAGDKKVSEICECSRGEAKEFRKKLFASLPTLETLIKGLTEVWQSHAIKKWNVKYRRMEYVSGWVKGLDGRPIYIPTEHTVLVYMLQSDEAIMMAAAYLKFHQVVERKYKWGDDYGTLCWYHDEWIVECRAEIADDIAAIGEQSIEWAGNFFNIACPHTGKSVIGENWYEIH